MGVELHGVAHDVGHLVVASVFHAAHGVQDASLHGFQSVHDVGHGAFQNDVRGIVQKPVLVHAAQLVFHVLVFGVGGFVVRVFLPAFGQVVLFFLGLVKVFAHIEFGPYAVVDNFVAGKNSKTRAHWQMKAPVF